MALDGLEAVLAERYPSRSGRQVHLIRFADDFVITGNSKSLLENEILPLVVTFLQERGLSLSQEKTVITHINDGFDFLGQTIRKYKGKLRMKPSRQSQRTLLNKVRRIIKTDGKFLTAYGLINRLTPIIRGWANYHRHVASSRTFTRIDYQIYRALWCWAKRKHRNKSRKWIYSQYFIHPKTGRRIFHSTHVNDEGQREIVELVIAARIGYQQHVKIRRDANPYDPAWEPYFERRQYHKVKGELHGRSKLLRQWHHQLGICPVCRELITKQTGWHNHHIVWKVHGGDDEPNNLVLLHPSCHRQVHSPDYNGPSLRPSMGVRDA